MTQEYERELEGAPLSVEDSGMSEKIAAEKSEETISNEEGSTSQRPEEITREADDSLEIVEPPTTVPMEEAPKGNSDAPEELPAPEALLYYAASTGGFYHTSLHTEIPVDAMRISEEIHESLMAAQSKGDTIMPPDEDHPLPWAASPPPLTLEAARAAKLAEIMHGYKAAFSPLEAMYPAAEREGWPVQEAEAKAALADPEAATPVLTALAMLRGRGESVADLAAKVIENSTLWMSVYALLTGQQQRMYGEVMALTTRGTPEDVAAYPVAYQLPEGM